MQPMPRPRPLARGAMLIEGLVVIAVLTVALGLAAPGIGKARERRHLDGIAAQLETDLLQARTLAVSMNRTVRLSFAGGAGGSCYFIHTGTPDGCACGPAGAACPGGEVMRSVHVDADSPVTLRANVRSMVFAPEGHPDGNDAHRGALRHGRRAPDHQPDGSGAQLHADAGMERLPGLLTVCPPPPTGRDPTAGRRAATSGLEAAEIVNRITRTP